MVIRFPVNQLLVVTSEDLEPAAAVKLASKIAGKLGGKKVGQLPDIGLYQLLQVMDIRAPSKP